MAAPFVFSTTGRTIVDPTRSHLTVSLTPTVPRSSTAPYAPAHCVDNKQHYTVKGVGWDRWADERWTDKSERAWMTEAKHAPADKQQQLNRSRQYREYTMQQAHFADSVAGLAAAAAAGEAEQLAGTNTSTSYAAIGSHYRSSLAVDATVAIQPPSTLNTSTFESSSKRLGIDPHATGTYVSCYGGDYKETPTSSTRAHGSHADDEHSSSQQLSPPTRSATDPTTATTAWQSTAPRQVGRLQGRRRRRGSSWARRCRLVVRVR